MRLPASTLDRPLIRHMTTMDPSASLRPGGHRDRRGSRPALQTGLHCHALLNALLQLAVTRQSEATHGALKGLRRLAPSFLFGPHLRQVVPGVGKVRRLAGGGLKSLTRLRQPAMYLIFIAICYMLIPPP